MTLRWLHAFIAKRALASSTWDCRDLTLPSTATDVGKLVCTGSESRRSPVTASCQLAQKQPTPPHPCTTTGVFRLDIRARLRDLGQNQHRFKFSTDKHPAWG